MDYVFPPHPQPSLPVEGSAARFPLRRIFCVGRNYAEHAREMGNDPDREPPFFFTKPADALVQSGAEIPYPPATQDLHHEAELVVCLSRGGADIPAEHALAHVFGYAAGNDLTRRDLQWEAKAAKRPWDMSKGFDHSAVIGAIRTGQAVPDGGLRAWVGDELRQSAPLATMIWPVPMIIAYLSRLVTLAPGDIIMTGTPAGVGPILRGQDCRVEIDGLAPAVVRVV